MESRKYFEKCVKELFDAQPELALDKTFLGRFEEQLCVKKPLIRLTRWKLNTVNAIMNDNECEDDNVSLDKLSTKLKSKIQSSSLAPSSPSPLAPSIMQSPSVLQQSDKGKLVVEIQPSTAQHPLTYKIALPSMQFVDQAIRFEFEISSVFNITDPTKATQAKRRKNNQSKFEDMTPKALAAENVEVPSLMENSEENENVSHKSERTNKKKCEETGENKGAIKRKRGRKSKNESTTTNNKSELARFVEDFSCDCNQTHSTGSTPKVTSTTNQSTQNLDYYENFNLINYVNDAGNQNDNANDVESNMNQSTTQEAVVNSEVIYVSDISNMHYSLQDLTGCGVVCVPQWEINNNKELTGIDEEINANTATNDYLRENESFLAALDMPVLDETDAPEPNMPNVNNEEDKECIDVEPLEIENNMENHASESGSNVHHPDLFENFQNATANVENVTVEMPMSIQIKEQSDAQMVKASFNSTELNCVNSINLNETIDVTNITMNTPLLTESPNLEFSDDNNSIDVEIPLSIQSHNLVLSDNNNSIDVEDNANIQNSAIGLPMPIEEELSECVEEKTEVKDTGGCNNDDMDDVLELDCDDFIKNMVDTELESDYEERTGTVAATNKVNDDQQQLEIFYAGKIFEVNQTQNDMQIALELLAPFELDAAFKYAFNHKHLFTKHFSLFCDTYARVKNRKKLFDMIRDCGRYVDCEHFLQKIYTSLIECGFNDVNACRHILKNCIIRSPNTIDSLIQIIMQTDWTMFCDDLLNYSKHYGYKYSCETIWKMFQKVKLTTNAQLRNIFFECLNSMTPVESGKLPISVKQFILFQFQSKPRETIQLDWNQLLMTQK